MEQEQAKREDGPVPGDFATPAPANAAADAAGDAGDAAARVGTPLEPGQPVAAYDSVVDALRTVYDPEIPVNIYELGLIYRLDIGERGKVAIDMTLTAPGCPVAGSMPGMVADAVSNVEGTGEVQVRLVWDPPWSPALMSDDARMALDIA
jgi:FeS assembly SUF system protein